MRCTVIWKPEAEADLARIWMIGPSQKDIADAADRIDRGLGTDPERAGEEFYGDRLLVEPPLAVVFELFADDRRVEVL